MASDGILLCESYRRRRSNTPAVIASFAQEPWFCSGRSVLVTSDDLAEVRRRIERAVADGAPEQLKRLLDSVVEQIVVESRACVQPYFVAPMVRTRIGSRRRTGIEPA